MIKLRRAPSFKGVGVSFVMTDDAVCPYCHEGMLFFIQRSIATGMCWRCGEVRAVVQETEPLSREENGT